MNDPSVRDRLPPQARLEDLPSARDRVVASVTPLDPARQRALDDLVRLAAFVCRAPSSLITVNEAGVAVVRARYGAPHDLQIPSGSPCPRIAESGAACIVDDIAAGGCADVELPAGMRSYAGVPLITHDGHSIGTLCVVSPEPLRLTADAREMLEALARQVRDQLELQRRDAAMAESATERDWLVRFFSYGVDLFATANTNLRFEELNPAWERVLGWSRDELRSRPFTDFVHPDDIEATLSEATRIAQYRDVGLHFVNRYRHKDGHYVPLGWVSAIRDRTIYATARDLSQSQAQHEQALEQMRATADLSSRLRGILSSINHSVIETDLDGVIREFNAGAERMYGWRAEEVVGKFTPEILHGPEAMAELEAIAQRRLGRASSSGMAVIVEMTMLGMPFDFEWVARRKDGTPFPIQLSVTVRRDDAGRPVGLIGVSQDITERRASENRLRESQARLEKIMRTLDQTQDAIFILDPESFCFSYTNRGASRLTGYSAEELRVRTPIDIVRDGEFEGAQRALAPLVEGRSEAFHVEALIAHRDGHDVPVEIVMQHLASDDGAPQFIALVRDISERRRVDRLKDEFVSAVSHELRTPLTSIRGALGLLAGGALGELPADAVDFAQLAVANTDRLVRLVNDILDMEKIRSGRVTIEMVEQPIGPILARAVGGIEALAAARGVGITLRAPMPSEPVLVDADRLEQVLTNLLSNAVKFSPAGAAVEVETRVSERLLRLSVADHGPGVPENFRPRIFRPFAQADVRLSRELGGTGLGLSISRELVEKMGGRIGFLSRVGEGAEFFVELPRSGVGPLDPSVYVSLEGEG
jgi:PAS domain S-box-containing protein